MRTPLFIFFTLLALILALFVGLIAYYTFNPPTIEGDRVSVATETRSPDIVPPTRPVITSTDPIRGNPQSTITIVEFGDFLCDACAEVEPVLQKILQEYAGKVKLVWKDLPNTRRHALAQKAAEAARCADEQGKFWEYHDLLLKRQNDVAQSFSSDIRPEGLSYFTVIARELALNTAQFSDCLTLERTRELVTRTFNEALLLRVDATPYFFISESRHSGAPTVEQLRAILNAYVQ